MDSCSGSAIRRLNSASVTLYGFPLEDPERPSLPGTFIGHSVSEIQVRKDKGSTWKLNKSRLTELKLKTNIERLC